MGSENQIKTEARRDRFALPYSVDNVEQAREHAALLAKTGGKSWRMCVPVQPDDSDMLFVGLCESHEWQRARIVALEAQVKRDRERETLIADAAISQTLSAFLTYSNDDTPRIQIIASMVLPKASAIIASVDAEGEGGKR